MGPGSKGGSCSGTSGNRPDLATARFRSEARAVGRANVDQQNVPPNLSDDVEMYITDALKKRPDIAAQIAAIRVDDAAIAGAKSEFYPQVGVSGNYGQIIWSYTVNGGHTQNLNQPFYGALLTLRGDLFTGFDRYYQ
jgi:outer membrane protein TolC